MNVLLIVLLVRSVFSFQGDSKFLKGKLYLLIAASVSVELVDRKMIDRYQHFPCFNSSWRLFSASKLIDFSIKYENRQCGEAAEVSVN